MRQPYSLVSCAQPLQLSEITQIVKLRSMRLIERMAEKRMVLDLRESAVEYLAAVGYDPVYGARWAPEHISSYYGILLLSA